jgi:hypothetical protein
LQHPFETKLQKPAKALPNSDTPAIMKIRLKQLKSKPAFDGKAAASSVFNRYSQAEGWRPELLPGAVTSGLTPFHAARRTTVSLHPAEIE